MKKGALYLSVVINIMLLTMLIYVKRDRLEELAVHVTGQGAVAEKDISAMNAEQYSSPIQVVGQQYQQTRRVLIVGNSISLHGISKEVNWTHESGMAASSADKDYVHLLANMLSEDLKAKIEFRVVNVADFERNLSDFNYDRLKEAKEFNADLVIFQIGENVGAREIADGGAKFNSAYLKLIDTLPAKHKIVTLPFWPDKDKINIITGVAVQSGASIVDLSHLGSGVDQMNMARSENKYSNAGVGAHPGDYGMQNIAKSIFSVARNVMKG